MSAEFCVVTRKKWIARRSLQFRPRLASDKGCNEGHPKDVDYFLSRLEKLCKRMVSSDYFTQAMEVMQKSLSALPPKTLPERIVCFGLGPFTRNFQALHQLAFIVEVQRHYKIKEAYYYDPMFNYFEETLLECMQCKLMHENCEAKFEADIVTLFYMPHCPNFLTNNLLWRNWQPTLLQKIVLINNSFNTLANSKPHRVLRLDADYILDILVHTKEFALEDDYHVPNVFNDLSVHIFPGDQLPARDDVFWTQKEAPTYPEIETVTAKNLEKLCIT